MYPSGLGHVAATSHNFHDGYNWASPGTCSPYTLGCLFSFLLAFDLASLRSFPTLSALCPVSGQNNNLPLNIHLSGLQPLAQVYGAPLLTSHDPLALSLFSFFQRHCESDSEEDIAKRKALHPRRRSSTS